MVPFASFLFYSKPDHPETNIDLNQIFGPLRAQMALPAGRNNRTYITFRTINLILKQGLVLFNFTKLVYAIWLLGQHPSLEPVHFLSGMYEMRDFNLF